MALELHYYRPQVYTFGAPRVADEYFKKIFKKLIPESYAIIADSDPVPRIPTWFERVGEEIWILENGSLKRNPKWWQRLYWFVWDKCRTNDHSIENSYLKRIQK